MKQLFFFALLGLMVTACGEAPAGEKVEANEAVETQETAAEDAMAMAVDTDATIINWTGAKLVGKQHTGTINVSEGSLQVADGQLVGGEFVIDMTSIKNIDMAGSDGAAKLEGHLRDGDFFEANAYPTATFSIAEVTPATEREDATHLITGNLTMKDITKSITIPAMVKIGEAGISAKTPEFTIDRTQWNVMYGASALGVAQDEIINDNIGLQINLSAK